MRSFELVTRLPASCEEVWRQIQSPRLMLYVCRGLISFKPLAPETLPELWTSGEYRVRPLLFGFIPLGWQIIGVEMPTEDRVYGLRDNGRSSLIKIWDHRIEVEQAGGGTRYVDDVEIEAGPLTGLVWLYAKALYRYRQRRLQKLVGQVRRAA